MTVWVFRQCDDPGIKEHLFEEIKRGRLRQGWGHEHADLHTSMKDWIRACRHYNWGRDINPHHTRLYKMCYIEPGDLIVVPNQPNNDSFVLVRAVAAPGAYPSSDGAPASCYTFIDPVSALHDNDDFNDDFRHCVTVDRVTLQIIKNKRVRRRLFPYRECVQEVSKIVDMLERLASPSAAIPEEELSDQEAFPEGTLKQVSLNIHERNTEARAKCLKHYGYDCSVCGFNFKRVFGEIGDKFIHVHHLIAISCKGKRDTNPIRDLRPVCPNCHAIIHRRNPAYTIEGLRKILKPI